MDRQRSKVYRWENEVVAPRDSSLVPFEKAQGIVDAVWMAQGLIAPPKVSLLAPQNKRAWATGSRLSIELRPEPTPRWVILHEIAHAMTSTHDGQSERHGAKFVGIYMKLLDKFLDIPVPLLMFTASKSGVEFDIGAQPSFLDEP